jgi:UDPglucose 6-dehydrogenase
MRVAIIGTGFIGKAQARMLAAHQLVTYDVADGLKYPHDGLMWCDFAMVCVGTPSLPDGSADLSAVHEAVRDLPWHTPVLIRSTVTPGTTEALQALYPGRVIAHCPEFMHERPGGAWSETTDVPFLIIGGRRPDCELFARYLAEVFPGKIHLTTSRVSELVKYVVNLHLATRVTFINEMAGICEKFSTDWEDVREAWLMDPRITPEYTGMAGYPPGFGGRCWPKDLSAIIAAAEAAGYEPEFFHAVEDANARFRGQE